MAQFKSIISSILRDIIAAQHEANIFSHSISEEYSGNGRVRGFRLPGAVLNDIEMELKCGINGTGESAETNIIEYDKVRDALRNLNAMAAEPLVNLLSKTAGPDDGFFQRMERSDRILRNYQLFIRRILNGAVIEQAQEFVDKETGGILRDKLVETMLTSVKERILEDKSEDNPFKFTEESNAGLWDEFLKRATEMLRRLIDTKMKNKDFRKSFGNSNLDVTVESDELSKMPDISVHSFKLRFAPVQTDTLCESTSDMETK